MNFLDNTIDFIEDLTYWVGSSCKQHLSDYVDVECNDSKFVFALKDGSLMTIVRMHGSRMMVGRDEFSEITKAVRSSLEAYLSNGGHALQIFFQHDNSNVVNRLNTMYEASRRSARNIGFAIDDIIRDRVASMAEHCHIEDCYFALRTRVDAVTKADLKRSKELKGEALKVKKGAIATLSMNPLVAVDALRDRHNAFINTFCSDMHEAGLIVDKMEAHGAARAIRKTIDEEFTDDAWEPSLVGDKLPFRITAVERDDISNILWPKLDMQLTPRNGTAINHQFFSIGNRIYATISVDAPPKDPKVFNVLFKRMINSGIPWRMSMNIGSGGLKSVALKKAAAAIAGILHSGNKAIVDGYNELSEQVRTGGEIDAKFSMCFSTWVADGDIKKLGSRLSLLARAVEGWGVCEVHEIPGDSASGFMSTVLGQVSDGVAVHCAAPLTDVVNMLPVTRSASPWENGSILFRTPDGKVWPYHPGSSKQVAWIDLFFAGMGSGKSVLMNGINLALCHDPRIKRLPRLASIDIGSSSEGVILMLKDQLPEGRKHEAAYHRLRMRSECATNPFDTQLGCRFPIASHRAFLTNFVMLLTTPIGQTKPYDGLADMVGLVIDETYRRLSDDIAPRIYSVGTDPQVDAMLEEINFTVDKRATWWEAVDALFKAGKVRGASLAQRHAVPTLNDLVSASQADSIKDLFQMTLPTGELPSVAFNRMISTAIREYPIISLPTQFDLGEARVVSLDLDEVAKTGGEAADRQTAIMYMLARFILARDFYITMDNLPEMNPAYANFHKQKIREAAEDIKRISIDEFHRTKKAQSVREQFVTDIREGRKWGVHVALASQDLDDFDDIMISLATSIFIMGKFDQKDVKAISERFGLGDTERYALTNSTHGPRPGVGATFLVNLTTKDASSRTSQLVTSTIGPIEYWALSTTAEDKIIRSMAYGKIGGIAARRLLSRTYPWGIQKEVERRSEDISESAFDDAAVTSIIDQIYNEIMQLHFEESRKQG